MTAEPGQDDLTAHDHDSEIVNTEKFGPDDETIEQPPQDPDWLPNDGECA